MKRLQCLFILLATTTIALAQKVVPGVNPQHYQAQQHYQQQVPQQQYAQPGQVPMQPIQPQMQHQQMHHPQMPPQQMQQQPIHQQQQQQQQQQQMHQQPIHQQPMQQQPNAIHQQQQMNAPPHPQGHRPHQPILDTANIQGEKVHIQEHMDVPMDTSKMSEQELQFHYFKMHDSDQNNKLDGCELIKSLIHWHEKSNKDEAHHSDDAHHQGHQDKIFSDEELVALIDPILAMDDTGRDGYIDYPEFIKAQQKAAAQQKPEKP